MPDYEGLIRAVSAATGFAPHEVRDGSEAQIAAHIASMGATKPQPIIFQMAEAKPALTGEQVRAAVEHEFDFYGLDLKGYGEVGGGDDERRALRALGWDRVARRLAQP